MFHYGTTSIYPTYSNYLLGTKWESRLLDSAISHNNEAQISEAQASGGVVIAPQRDQQLQLL